MDEPEAATIDELVAERKAVREAQSEQTPESVEPTSEVDQQEADEQEIEPSDDGSKELSDDQTSDETDEESEETNLDGEAEDDEAEEQPPIDAPHFWTPEGKEHFANLDPVTQQFVLDQDKKSQAFVTKTRQELTQQVMQQVNLFNQQNQAKLEQLDTVITQNETLFRQKYATDSELNEFITSGQVTTEQAMQHRIERDAAKEAIDKDRKSYEKADAELRAQIDQARTQTLSETQPEILQPENARAIAQYVVSQGTPSEALNYASAGELTMAYKAMLYDRGHEALRSKSKKAPKKPTKTLKPSGQKSAPSKNARLAALEKRASETGSMEDILAARKARRESKAA